MTHDTTYTLPTREELIARVVRFWLDDFHAELTAFVVAWQAEHEGRADAKRAA